VPLHIYDETITVLKAAMQKAKLGQDERLMAIKHLDDKARELERSASGPSVAEFIAREREDSHLYGGRTVFGEAIPPPEAQPATASSRR
jgi:hypothetical protein